MNDFVKIAIHNSSLIKYLKYDGDILEVGFHSSYFVDYLTYDGVTHFFFEEMCKAESIGKFYLKYIKPNFNQILKTIKMAETPKGINIASDKKRFLKMRIDVKKLNKDFFFIGKDGAVYADITLMMLPDGETDKYENLGMIVQDVPKAVYEKDKTIKGEILGNAKELLWEDRGGEGNVGGGGTIASQSNNPAAFDDLPF